MLCEPSELKLGDEHLDCAQEPDTPPTLVGGSWHKGNLDEAIKVFNQIICWNPNDNQGIRDILSKPLLIVYHTL